MSRSGGSHYSGGVSGLANPVVKGCNLSRVGAIGRDYGKVETGRFSRSIKLIEIVKNVAAAEIFCSGSRNASDPGEPGRDVARRQGAALIDVGENHTPFYSEHALSGLRSEEHT